MVFGCWLAHTIEKKKTNRQKPKLKIIICYSTYGNLWNHVNIHRFIDLGSEVKLNQAELKLSLTSTPAAPFRLTDGLTIIQIEVRGHCQM